MLGFTTIANWFRSAHSLSNELDARIKKAEEEVRAEWQHFTARIVAIEEHLGLKAKEVIAETKVGVEEVKAAAEGAPVPTADSTEHIP